MKCTELQKPVVWRNSGDTEQVIEFVKKIESDRGYGTMWLNMTYGERLQAEWRCQGDADKEKKVKFLRSIEILFRPIQDVLAEDDMRLGNE